MLARWDLVVFLVYYDIHFSIFNQNILINMINQLNLRTQKSKHILFPERAKRILREIREHKTALLIGMLW